MHEHDETELQANRDGPPPAQLGNVDRMTQAALVQGRVDRLQPEGLTALQRSAGNRGVADLVEEDAGESVRSVVSS